MEQVILGGGYTCSVCGKYQRTSAICHHNNPIINNMKQLPTAEQLLHIKGITCVQAEEIAKFMIEFAKIHVKAALESAAEKADTKEVRGVCDDYRVVDEKSILNAYNLDNIK